MHAAWSQWEARPGYSQDEIDDWWRIQECKSTWRSESIWWRISCSCSFWTTISSGGVDVNDTFVRMKLMTDKGYITVYVPGAWKSWLSHCESRITIPRDISLQIHHIIIMWDIPPWINHHHYNGGYPTVNPPPSLSWEIFHCESTTIKMNQDATFYITKHGTHVEYSSSSSVNDLVVHPM